VKLVCDFGIQCIPILARGLEYPYVGDFLTFMLECSKDSDKEVFSVPLYRFIPFPSVSLTLKLSAECSEFWYFLGHDLKDRSVFLRVFEVFIQQCTFPQDADYGTEFFRWILYDCFV
jgi:hypothetical protein